VNQHRARVVSRAWLTAVPTGSQVFATAAPMVVPIPEVWVSAVRAVTVEPMAEPTEVPTVEPMAEPTEVPTVEPTVAQMEAQMEAPTVVQMEALTVVPTVARTVGRVDPRQNRSV
jgi:hypothetical protein